MNRHVRNLFLLRLAGEGQPGAGDPPVDPPADGGAGDGGDGGGEPGAQPPKTISAAEHKKVQRENQNLRARLREAEAAKTKAAQEAEKLKTHFNVENIDDLPEPPVEEPPAAPPPAPGVKAPPQRSAESIRLEKQVADLTREQKQLREERAKEHREKIRLQRDSVLNDQIRQMGLTDPQEIDTAFAKLEKHTITTENEDGTVTFTQKFIDPKTKEELEESPSFQTASLILPKSLQPARGGPGSGGGQPRLSSDPKDNDLLSKAVGSQAEYEKNRPAVITAERAQQARTGGTITTDTGSRG